LNSSQRKNEICRRSGAEPEIIPKEKEEEEQEQKQIQETNREKEVRHIFRSQIKKKKEQRRRRFENREITKL
jgi:hypothetical protein